jgi:hypothetical protein
LTVASLDYLLHEVAMAVDRIHMYAVVTAVTGFQSDEECFILDPLRRSLSLRTLLFDHWLPSSRFRGSLPIGEAPNVSTRDGA